MTFPTINAPWPRQALKFFLKQATAIAPIETRQQEILVTVDTALAISNYNIANPLATTIVEVTNIEPFYPGGGIIFWMSCVGDGYVPLPNDDGRCNLIAQVGWTAAQVAAGYIAQINAYAAAMHLATDGYYDTLTALPGPAADQFRLLMPVGTNGAPSAINIVGPVPIDAVLTFGGITVPLAVSLLGPRRHIFRVGYPMPRGGGV
jgi:hypothetical protein